MREVPFNELESDQDEALSILAEECAEVIQVIQKIQRHGLHSYNPFDPDKTPNHALLDKELGDVLAATMVAGRLNMVDVADLPRLASAKFKSMAPYLHHIHKSNLEPIACAPFAWVDADREPIASGAPFLATVFPEAGPPWRGTFSWDAKSDGMPHAMSGVLVDWDLIDPSSVEMLVVRDA